jgi:hypothetical protein
MSGLPAIYWYAFWIVAVAGALGFGFYVATITHRRNMKALEVLQSYAERGVEPPASIAEPLAAQIMDSRNTAKQWGREHLVRSFVGFLFSASVIGGIYFWLAETDGPLWAIGASRAGMAFFGFGAFGLLLASLFSRSE